MTTVKDILAYLESIAPSYMKEDWDRIGLNCGHVDRAVTKILIALDPFKDVCNEALEIGADLLITHHALLWTPGFITDINEQGRNTLFLIENNIAHINAHTNLDHAPGGVNDILASKLGLSNVSVIAPKGEDALGRPWGLLRMGEVREQTLSDFLALVKTQLNCPGLRYVNGGKPVCKVAVGGGACAGELQKAVSAGCDTFITADVRYNQFWEAHDLGLTLIDAGHFYTENPICVYLAEKLCKAFPDVAVSVSASHMDCAKFFA